MLLALLQGMVFFAFGFNLVDCGGLLGGRLDSGDTKLPAKKVGCRVRETLSCWPCFAVDLRQDSAVCFCGRIRHARHVMCINGRSSPPAHLLTCSAVPIPCRRSARCRSAPSACREARARAQYPAQHAGTAVAAHRRGDNAGVGPGGARKRRRQRRHSLYRAARQPCGFEILCASSAEGVGRRLTAREDCTQDWRTAHRNNGDWEPR